MAQIAKEKQRNNFNMSIKRKKERERRREKTERKRDRYMLSRGGTAAKKCITAASTRGKL